MPLKDYVTGKLRRSLIALWCAVGAILLIAGVNLSNLLLARAAARAKEFAVRGALGASRGRIVRQLLMESLVLSGAGAALGLGLALSLIDWLTHQGSLALPLLSALRIDSAGAGLDRACRHLHRATIFGLLPGLRIASGNLQEVLKDSGPGAGLGRKHERVRSALVVSEVALACVLLVSAGLLLRSFLKVLDVDLGFQPRPRRRPSKSSTTTALRPTKRASETRAQSSSRSLLSVSALPGVEGRRHDPITFLSDRTGNGTRPCPRERPSLRGNCRNPLVYVITPGFIRAMGIRLHGRDFTWSDGPHSERVVLINASAARFYWPGEDRSRQDPHARDRGKTASSASSTMSTKKLWRAGRASQIYYPVTQQGPRGRATGSPHQLAARGARLPASCTRCAN